MADYPIQRAKTVAYRALCLGTLLKRHSLEMAINNLGELPNVIQAGWKREHEGIYQHLKKWIAEEKIIDHFSSDERMLWDANLGDWQQLDRAKVYWRCESLGILLWAMKGVETPYYDSQFDIEMLLEPLDLMSPTIDFIWMASLRDGKVIHKARDLAQTWHWRAVAHTLDTDNEQIKKIAEETYSSGNLPRLLEDDFPVLGKAYARLTDDEYTKIASIAKERHHVLNWLCRYGDDWDTVPLQSG